MTQLLLAINSGLSTPYQTHFTLNAHLVYKNCSQSRQLCTTTAHSSPLPGLWPQSPSLYLFVLLVLAPHILGEAS